MKVRRSSRRAGQRLLEAAALASDAHVVLKDGTDRWHVKGDPTEGALVVAAAKAGLDKADLDARSRASTRCPSRPRRKRMTTLHARPTARSPTPKGHLRSSSNSCTRVADRWRRAIAGTTRTEQAVLEAARRMAGRRCACWPWPRTR